MGIYYTMEVLTARSSALRTSRGKQLSLALVHIDIPNI
jgi:hypothetical protein